MPAPQRYMLTIAYRGTRYHGWQHQAANPRTWKGPTPPDGEGIPTVQATLSRRWRNELGQGARDTGPRRTYHQNSVRTTFIAFSASLEPIVSRPQRMRASPLMPGRRSTAVRAIGQ